MGLVHIDEAYRHVVNEGGFMERAVVYTEDVSAIVADHLDRMLARYPRASGRLVSDLNVQQLRILREALHFEIQLLREEGR